MNFRKIFACILSCAVIGGALPHTPYCVPVLEVTADEEAVTASGQCGENLKWVLDAEGTFTVSGTGAMSDDLLPHEIEWSEYKGNITTVVIEEGVTAVGSEAFNGCAYLTEVKLPSTLTIIYSGAFAGCYELTTITLPENLEAISGSVFDSTPLTEINVVSENEHFVSLDGILFSKDMTRLIRYPEGKTETSYNIPASVRDIDSMAFYNCRYLEAFEVATESEYFSSNDGVIFSYDGTKLIRCPYRQTDISSYTVPDGVEIIGEYAFNRCLKLNEIILPESVAVIEKSAFSGCQYMTDINFPKGLVSIGNSAFMSCNNLTEITIPKDIAVIEDFAFYACRSLSTVVIPENVESIGSWAFGACDSLDSITIENPDCEIYDNVYTIDDTATIYAYSGSTAQAYAEKYGRNFIALNDASAESGDANGNGIVEVADAVFILQGIADPSNQDFALSESGMITANCKNPNGSGVDSEDALAIQMFMAELIPSLPAE